MRAGWLHLFVSAAALSIAAPALAADARLEQVFADPPRQAEPRVRWWWPGADVTAEELEREIALLDDLGFAGAEIQALTPNVTPPISAEAAARVNDYAEPRFFDLVRDAGTFAKSRGFELDYTFGSAWPSGGGFVIPPEKALVELTMAYTPVAGGTQGPIKVTVPERTSRLGALGTFDARTRDPAVADWKDRFDGRARTVRVLAVRGIAPSFSEQAGPSPLNIPIKLSAWKNVSRPGTLATDSTIDLTDRMRADGTLDWTAPDGGDWLVFVFREYASNMGALGAAGRGPQLVLDHFDRTAFAAHAARVGDPLGSSPPGIRSTFVDSLELMQDLQWSDDFLDRFRALRGYDLAPYLPLLPQAGWMAAWNEHFSPPYFNAADPNLADRVREDYRQTVSDLLFSEFLEPWVGWNHAHGLKAKFQAHGGALDEIRAYGLADIPETEDLVHGGDPLFMRFARSAADLYGRDIVSAESLVWKDRPYDVTPDEMRSRLDLLFAGGVNSVNLHGVPYRYATQNWPGWHAFAPSFAALGFSTMLAESNPVWAAMPKLSRYIARSQALLQAGEPVVPVALYYGDIGYYVGIETAGSDQRPIEEGLISGGYDYDRINPDSIARASVRGGALISAGGHAYRALVVPPVEAMSPEVAEKIAGFVRAGLPVIFVDSMPERSVGLREAKARDAREAKAVAALRKDGVTITSAGALAQALRGARVPANLTFEQGGEPDLFFVQRRLEDQTVSFLYNASDKPRKVPLTLDGLGSVARWDAMDGTKIPVDARLADGGTSVAPAIEAHQGIFLVHDRAGKPATVPAFAAGEQVVGSPGSWKLSVDGIREGKPFAAELGAASLTDWRDMDALANFSGAGTYSTTVAIPADWLTSGRRVALALGDVHDMAEVRLNGGAPRVLISRPWRLDVTDQLIPGDNKLEIVIRNVPQNALLSDKGPNRKLVPVPAGLSGPVQFYTFGEVR